MKSFKLKLPVLNKRSELLNVDTIVIATAIIAIFMIASTYIYGQETIGEGELPVEGLRLMVRDKPVITPAGTPALVETTFSVETDKLLQGMMVKGELRGPGLSEPLTLTTLPDHPFNIPAMARKGDYFLENICLEHNGRRLISAEPETVKIRVMDILVTSIESRPLSLEEIREKGITISDENFTVYNFTIAIEVESKPVHFSFPVVYTPDRAYIPKGVGGSSGGGFSPGGKTVPMDFQYPPNNAPVLPGDPEVTEKPEALKGFLVFSNDVAFLNQFFSIMFIVANNAPNDSGIELKDLEAVMTFPTGLKEAQTNPPRLPGTAVPVVCPGPDKKIGTDDDLTVILGTFSGMAEFLAEGVQTGSHMVEVDFKGTISGLPGGDRPVEGSAAGVVMVKNPSFSLTFAHPEVIREGETYDILVTLTNTSGVNANLVSLTMPGSRIIGCRLLSDDTHHWDTIKPGESQEAVFNMLSMKTGKVRASAIEIEGQIDGRFVLTAGVGEEGIPLSPDTLILPSYTYHLPTGIINAAMRVLGEAYSVATTPPGGLPGHLPLLDRDTVTRRVVQTAMAGRRNFYGENDFNGTQTLALDWLGNDDGNLPFDRLRRLTSKGKFWADAQGEIFNSQLKGTTPDNTPMTPTAFLESFAETACHKNPFLGVMLSFPNNGPRTARILLRDQLENQTTSHTSQAKNEDGEETLLRQIPFTDHYALTGADDSPLDLFLAARPENQIYEVEITGITSGTFDLTLLIPAPKPENANHWTWNRVTFAAVTCEPDYRYKIKVQSGDTAFSLTTHNDSGIPVGTIPATPVPVTEPVLKVLGATQDCGISAAGQVVGVVFNKPLNPATAKIATHYRVNGNHPLAVFLQEGNREVLLHLPMAVSPFRTNQLQVLNLTDSAGNTLQPPEGQTVPVTPTIGNNGGIVYGAVTTAAGEPVKQARVILTEPLDEKKPVTRFITQTDDRGHYQFDYIRMQNDAFTLTIRDAGAGINEELKGRITVPKQRLALNLALRGTASVTGRVTNSSGKPANQASVRAYPADAEDRPEWRAQTDAEGNYSLSGLPVGPVHFYTNNSADYEWARNSLTLTETGAVHALDIQTLARKNGSVRVQVLFFDGKPSAIQRILLYRNGIPMNYHGKTNADGVFFEENLEVGNITVSAYNPNSGDYQDLEMTVKENQTAAGIIVFRGFTTITGRVMGPNPEDTSIMEPKPGITVYIPNTACAAETGENGEYELKEVPVGERTVHAYDPATMAQVYQKTAAVYEHETYEVNLTYPKPPITAVISGTITNAQALGLDLTDKEVWVFNSDGMPAATGRCNGANEFLVENMRPGRYKVVLKLDHHAGVSEEVMVGNDGQHVNTAITLVGKGRMKIRVLNHTENAGVKADVTVRCIEFKMIPGTTGFQGAIHRFTTDENGEAVLGNIYHRPCAVSAKNSFYPGGDAKTVTLAGDLTEVKLVMPPSGTVLAVLKNAEGTVMPKTALNVNFQAGAFRFEQIMTTDAEGKLEIRMVPMGDFTITVEEQADQWVASASGTLTPESPRIEKDLQLKCRGSVTVTVTENRDNQTVPVAGALVTVGQQSFPYRSIRLETDAQGTATAEHVEAGALWVSVSETAGASLRGGRTTGTLQCNQTLALSVELAANGTLTGRVLREDGQTPAQRCMVEIRKPTDLSVLYGSTITDVAGEFRMEQLPAEAFVCNVQDPLTGRITGAEGVIKSNDTVTVNMQLQQWGHIRGRFFDGSGTQPIIDGTVRLIRKDNVLLMTDTTDADGGFSFENIPVGPYTVEATGNDKINGVSVKTEVACEGHRVDLDLVGPKLATISGIVYAGPGKTNAAANATVTLLDARGEKIAETISALTGTVGSFTLNNVRLGTWTIKAKSRDDDRTGEVQVTTTHHGQVAADTAVTYAPTATVRGTVMDGATPAAGYKVLLANKYHSAGTTTSFNAGSEGTFTFTYVPPGTYTLTVSADGDWRGATEEITVNGDMERTLTLAVQGSISGSLMLNAETPAVSAYVVLTQTVDNITKTFSTRSGADGSFVFNSLPPGVYGYEALGGGGIGRLRGTLTVTADNNTDAGVLTLDTEPPTVAASVPAENSGEFNRGGVISVTFSEAVDPATLLPGRLRLRRNGQLISGTVAMANDTTGTFTPAAPLDNFAVFVLEVDGGVTDKQGNRMGLSRFIPFSTMDDVAPTIPGSFVETGAVNVPLAAEIFVEFNESIDWSSVADADGNVLNDTVVLTVNGDDQPLPIRVSTEGNRKLFIHPVDGNGVRLSPPLQSDQSYVLTIGTGVKDLAGNAPATPYTLNFKSLDTQAPQLSPLTVKNVAMTNGKFNAPEGMPITIEAVTTADDVKYVQFFVAGKVVDAVTVPVPTGEYELSFTAPLISQSGSSLTVEAYAVDITGNRGAKTLLDITLLPDTVPEITISRSGDGPVRHGDTVTITVNASDNNGLKSMNYTYSALYHAITGTHTVVPAGDAKQATAQWDIVIPADMGPNDRITVTAAAVEEKDDGRTVSAQPLVLKMLTDTAAPTLTVDTAAPTEPFTIRQTIRFAVTATDAEYWVESLTCSAVVDGATVPVSRDPEKSNEFVFTVPALSTAQEVVFRVRAADPSGNAAEATYSAQLAAYVDTAPPQVVMLSPSSGTLMFPGEQLRLRARATDQPGEIVDRVEFTINNAPLPQVVLLQPASGQTDIYEGIFTVPEDWNDGTPVTITAKAVDAAEKVSNLETVSASVAAGTVFTQNTTLTNSGAEVDDTYKDVTVIVNGCTLTVNGAFSFADLLVKGGGKVVHSPTTVGAVNRLDLRVGGAVVVDGDSVIDVSGRGYVGSNGPGNAGQTGRTIGNTLQGGSWRYGGGSHGGRGGQGLTDYVGYVYGSPDDPDHPGAGGGGGGSTPKDIGGSGGGICRISASQLVLDGGIYADGASTTSQTASGGAGGSIRIDCGVVSGSGRISADGGDAVLSGAGGGGGRIALYYDDADAFNLETITSVGGVYLASATPKQNGAPGTVYLKKGTDTARLLVDNRGLAVQNDSEILYMPDIPAAFTRSTSSATTLESVGRVYAPDILKGVILTVTVAGVEKSYRVTGNSADWTNGVTQIFTDPADGDLPAGPHTYRGKRVYDAHLVVRNININMNGAFEFSDVTLAGTTVLSHSPCTATLSPYLWLDVSGTVTVESGTAIDVTGRGYLGSYQGGNNTRIGYTYPNTTVGGAGDPTGNNSYQGGCHGGLGGRYPMETSLGVYGSLIAPVTHGSGGGSYDNIQKSSNGGGVIRIKASTFINDGKIAADGAFNSYVKGYYSSAGAGGSVYIHTGVLGGSGSISANGGSLQAEISGGGGGGGGRAAIYYDTIQPAGNSSILERITVYGGKGKTSGDRGGAGTIFIKVNAQPYGDLIVDNNGLPAPTYYDAPNRVTVIKEATPLPAVGVGDCVSNESYTLTDGNAVFKPDSLAGLFLVIDRSAADPVLYPIIGNSAAQLFTDPGGSAMPDTGTTPKSYMGTHVFRNVVIRGNARVITTDRVTVAPGGTITVETGSNLQKAADQ